MLFGWNSYGRYLIRILGSIEFFLIQVFNLSPIKIYNFKYAGGGVTTFRHSIPFLMFILLRYIS
jgi:hypothetical protein